MDENGHCFQINQYEDGLCFFCCRNAHEAKVNKCEHGAHNHSFVSLPGNRLNCSKCNNTYSSRISPAEFIANNKLVCILFIDHEGHLDFAEFQHEVDSALCSVLFGCIYSDEESVVKQIIE